jgi:FtsP/CotA-like multicopper oxidase with cupredoxin domain
MPETLQPRRMSSRRTPRALPQATSSEVVELSADDAYELRIGPVAKRLGGSDVRMLAYNGSIPGPTLRVRQGSEVLVDVVNEGDLEATVHWHGLRLDNSSDPDPGVYWYHPHIREDYGKEMGLYGNVIVVPEEDDYWPPVNRELALTLDDILLEEGRVAPFSRSETTHAAMGRFGDLMLVGGEPELELTAERGEVVRLYLTNTANTRVFNVGLAGARMKLVGGDSGRCEHEELVETVLLAPSERVVIDVLFEEPGRAILEHRTPGRSYRLAEVAVSEEPALPSLREHFEVLRSDPELAAERERIAPILAAEPDKELAFIAEMDMGEPEAGVTGASAYTCPMHPEVVSDEPGVAPNAG